MTSLGLSLYVFAEFTKFETDTKLALGISDGWELFFIMTTFAFLLCTLFLLITHANSDDDQAAISVSKRTWQFEILANGCVFPLIK